MKALHRVTGLLLAALTTASAAKTRNLLAQNATSFETGRFATAEPADFAHDPAPGTSSVLARLAAGTVPAELSTLEYELQHPGTLAAARRIGSGSALRAITELGFRLRGFGPALTATTDDPALLLLVYQAARDTLGVRLMRARLDSARLRLSLRNLPPPLILAEADLFLGDSAAALTRLLSFETNGHAMEKGVAWGSVQNGWLLGRTWLLLADLSLAMGRHTDAARAYRGVINLWQHGDAEVQPVVQRARAALADMEGTGSLRLAGDDVAAVTLRARPALQSARFRYDAVLWMAVPGRDGATRPLARLTMRSIETTRQHAEGGLSIVQRFDSIALDLPALRAIGPEGVALLRQVQGSTAGLRITTKADSLGQITSRSIEGAAAMPLELRELLERALGFGPLATAVPFPARALAPGASWTDSATLAIPGSGATITIPASYRLARIATVGRDRYAFITVDAAHGGVRLSGELVRDLATGESIRLAASLTAENNGAPVRILLTALREASPSAALMAMR